LSKKGYEAKLAMLSIKENFQPFDAIYICQGYFSNKLPNYIQDTYNSHNLILDFIPHRLRASVLVRIKLKQVISLAAKENNKNSKFPSQVIMCSSC
jgi:hypothetical protein